MALGTLEGRQEAVPSYEEAPNDPPAITYRFTQRRDLYELHCDTTGEHLSFRAPPSTPSKTAHEVVLSKKQSNQAIQVTRTIGINNTTQTQFAQLSPVTKKKLNLLRREPIVSMTTRHGTTPLTLFRGNYCGFKNPSREVEFYWQLRTREHRVSAARHLFCFRDAVLRRTVQGEKSTMTGMYLPYDKPEPAPRQSSESDESQHGTGADVSPEYEVTLGRLLVRSDLGEFDRDLALVSFIAVFVRVIEVEKRTPFTNAFVRAMTIGVED